MDNHQELVKKPTNTTTPNSIYQFKVTKKYEHFDLWRRIQVPGEYSFFDLHVAIQDAMGSKDEYFHKFYMNDPKTTIGAASAEKMENNYLGEIFSFSNGDKISEKFSPFNDMAIYRFGEYSAFGIMLENIFLAISEVEYPKCIAGACASPCLPEYTGQEDYDQLKNVEYERCSEECFDSESVKFQDPKEYWRLHSEKYDFTIKKPKITSHFIHQFKVTLKCEYIDVWRRIQLPGVCSFLDFHVAIQDSMGSKDEYFHRFDMNDPKTKKEISIGAASKEKLGNNYLGDRFSFSNNVKINKYFSFSNIKAIYKSEEYAEYGIVLEDIFRAIADAPYPKCIDGKGASSFIPECTVQEDYNQFEKLEHRYSEEIFDPESVNFRNPREYWQLHLDKFDFAMSHMQDVTSSKRTAPECTSDLNTAVMDESVKACSISTVEAPLICQFKITLKTGHNPPIWRRVQVPGCYTFYDFHIAIQNLFSWRNSHCHKFQMEKPEIRNVVRVGSSCFEEPSYKEFEKIPSEKTSLIAQYFPSSEKKISYVYDFGMDWEHTIVFEKSLPYVVGMQYPRCIAGRRRVPPEDPSEEVHDEWMDEGRFELENCDPKLARFSDRKMLDSDMTLVLAPAPTPAAAAIPSASNIYQLKITLKTGFKPPTWRRIQVRGDYSFHDLHIAIQDVMEWRNSRGHHFELLNPNSWKNIQIGERRTGESDFCTSSVFSEEAAMIADYFLSTNDKIKYESCSWGHVILLEKILPAPTSRLQFPVCVAGRQKCPPEDAKMEDRERWKKIGRFEVHFDYASVKFRDPRICK